MIVTWTTRYASFSERGVHMIIVPDTFTAFTQDGQVTFIREDEDYQVKQDDLQMEFEHTPYGNYILKEVRVENSEEPIEEADGVPGEGPPEQVEDGNG